MRSSAIALTMTGAALSGPVLKSFDLDNIKLGDRRYCPGSYSPIHGSCDLTAVFQESCDDVKQEMRARLNGENGWTDPHNGGTYKYLGEEDNVLKSQRITNSIPKFLDHMNFGFQDTADGGCSVAACSDSSGPSAPDGETGYCNLFNLYCGSAEGCQVIHNDLHFSTQKGFCPNSADRKCLTTQSVSVSSTDSTPTHFVGGHFNAANDNCPGSPAKDYESCAMAISFASEDCATVRNEMEARLNGEDNWVDPHNEGSYVVVKSDSDSMQVKRYSGKNDGQGGGRYMDLMNFQMEDSNGGCVITACSDSQEESNNDQSTNYCNIRNLYKGTQNGGKPVNHDFKDFTEDINNNACPRHDHSRCN